MPNVKILCMNSSDIRSLPPSIGRLANLEILSLDCNSLSDLPITLEFCQKLSVVSLVANKFTHIPGVILKLKNLKELRTMDNPLVQIEQSVQATPLKAKKTAANNPKSLRRLGLAAALVNHLDYWKVHRFYPKQQNLQLEKFVSNATLCHGCGALMLQGNQACPQCFSSFDPQNP